MTVHRWRAFAVLAVAYFMTIVDLTIVNVALPTIGRKLHFSETNLQWVVTAYAVTFGGLLLLQQAFPQFEALGSVVVLAIGLAFLVKWAVDRGAGSLYAGSIITLSTIARQSSI